MKDSPEVFHFVQTIAIFLQNFTVLGLIFGPKVFKILIGQAEPTGSHIPGRTGNPRISLSRPNNLTGRRTSAPSLSGGGFRVDDEMVISQLDSNGKKSSETTPAAAERIRGMGSSRPMSNHSSDVSSSYLRSTDIWVNSNREEEDDHDSTVGTHNASAITRRSSVREASTVEIMKEEADENENGAYNDNTSINTNNGGPLQSSSSSPPPNPEQEDEGNQEENLTLTENSSEE